MSKKKQVVAPAKKTKPKKKVIGVDPLAWLSGDEDEQLSDAENSVDDAEANVITQAGNDSTSSPNSAVGSNSLETSQGEAPRIIKLGGCLEIREVQQLLDELKQELTSDGAIQLDASEIEKADTAGLQLITAFYQSAEAQGISVEWNKPSETLQRSAAQIGLSAELHL